MDILIDQSDALPSDGCDKAKDKDAHSQQTTHLIVTEQAKKLFGLCDESTKGCVKKEDLMRICDLIPGITETKLESVFDHNQDCAKPVESTVTISQELFVERIKPFLLHGVTEENGETEGKSKALSTPNSESGVLSRSLPFSSTQHSGDNYSILNNDDVTDENIAHSDTTDTANISDNNSSSDREEGERLTEDIHLRTQEGDSIENFDGSLQDELRTEQIGRAEGELLKKETENLNQLIEQQKQQQQRQHLERQEYPFSVENKLADVTDPICREVKSETNRNMRENLALDSLVKRESSSQVDLRRSLYHPDAKSPGSRSLAEELREVGVTNQDAPPCEPRPPNYSSPERIFKVVFVGDSAVGKTCFLHRFCHNRFKPLFNATIGVDFTVKTIRLQNRVIAVQLWDTAGQERFRSITKQYFRKADGVILMYDVTSEQSFLHVRNWIDSVKNGVDEACVMCLVGNKVDLFGSDHTHALTFKHGQKLAEEFNMLFFETSAFTGYNVNECMRAVAMRLQQREEDDLQEALKLEMGVQSSRRSWCCM